MMGAGLPGVTRGGYAMTDAACGCRVVYSGRVQGVGFRATAVTLAQEFPVHGWVRNLPDGRVELLAEGEREQVEAFLAAVRAFWGPAIRDEQPDWGPATSGSREFKVVR
jgi:acylphosphatase